MRELQDYRKCAMCIREEVMCVGVALCLGMVAAWLLYKNPVGVVLGIIIFPIYRTGYKKQKLEARKQKLLIEFKDGIQCISVALLAGFSIENAWVEAEKELLELYGPDADMTREIHYMNSGIRMNQPIEQLLYDFAIRSGCEDIVDFAEIFRFAKRSGGNFTKIVQNAAWHIAEKQETEREIATVLAGKKMEQKIMNVVPIGLLAYLNLTSGEFLAPLYGNLLGIAVMTLAFVAYVGAILMSQKMLEIEI